MTLTQCSAMASAPFLGEVAGVVVAEECLSWRYICDRRLSNDGAAGRGKNAIVVRAAPSAKREREKERRGRGGVASTSTPCTSVADVDELSRRVVGDLKLGGRSIIEPNLRSDRDRDTFHSLFPGNIQVKSSLFGRKKRIGDPERLRICADFNLPPEIFPALPFARVRALIK